MLHRNNIITVRWLSNVAIKSARAQHTHASGRSTTVSRVSAIAGMGAATAISLWTLYCFREHMHCDAALEKSTKKSTDSDSKKPKIGLALFKSHNTRDSLWVAIDAEVWDLTTFIDEHPGGADALLENAGKDATRLFHSIHPPNTLNDNLHPSMNVGRLDEYAQTALQQVDDEEAKRIKEARSKLHSVNSIISIDEFEFYAKDIISSTAWEYYYHGAETESAMRNHFSAYDRVFFRPRVLRNVWTVDLKRDILGYQSQLPFYVAPTAQNGLAQDLGEIAVTRGAGAQEILQVLSHVASKPLNLVCEARVPGQAVAWQLYMHPDRDKARAEIEAAVKLGVHSIWLTVDTAVLGKRTGARLGMVKRKPKPYDEPLNREPASVLMNRYDTGLNWSDVEWIKSIAPDTPLVLKGIGAWEDAVKAREAGADAICLSNHGGRELDYANAPLKTLYDIGQNAPEVIADKKFQIFVDGGIRRGTDVVKALCLGADAVGLGRPFIYAAAGWQSDGVERAILILREELEITMRLLGVTSLDQLGPQYLDCSKL